ncbi:MAG: hypothetical protein CMO47_11315 [Verrucomicrobiales bacterium]|nr:hypothetical protein [Verrucomicrobiales bacterium]
MSLDQATFEMARKSRIATVRFYHWNHPATTVGYFHQFSSTEVFEPFPIRRFTGGGLVEHGEDATFALVIPPDSAISRQRGEERYRWVHTALTNALLEAGVAVKLESSPMPPSNGPCFHTPVTWDLLNSETGEKLGGGAQRRSYGLVMHQGSVRLPATMRQPDSPWIQDFLRSLADTIEPLHQEEIQQLIEDAQHWRSQRFATREWNRWPSLGEV